MNPGNAAAICDAPPMSSRILLVRHGRSQHVQTERIDVEGFARWRESYEAAGIDERHETPEELRAIAVSSGVIVASEAPRAVQSARLLDPRREVIASPLLHELELVPPNIRGVRMGMVGWAVAYGVRWLVRAALRRPHVSAAEVERARAAADWLSELAERHGSVLAVTHASFRALLSRRLLELGWRCESRRGRTSHWSAWDFSSR